MNTKVGTALKKTGRILARAWVWVPLVIGLLFVIFLVLLPYGIRYGLERWLAGEGAEQVQVGDVDFNLFIGRLALRNVQVKVDAERTLLLPQASVRFALWPLLRKQVVVEDLYLRDTSISIEQTADGRWRFLGLAAAKETSGKPPGKKSAWGFVLRNAEINNSELHYKSPAVTGTAHVDNGEVAIRSRAGADGNSTLGEVHVRLNGRLQVERARAGVVAESHVSAEVTASAPAEKSGPWQITGAGQLRQLDIRWPDGKLRVASAESMNVEGLTVSGDEEIAIRALDVEGLTVAQGTAGDGKPAALAMSRLQTNDIRLVPGQTLDIADISLRGLRMAARHEARHRWYGINTLGELNRKWGAGTKPGPPLAVRIGRITLDEPGRIDVSDLTVKPAYRERLTLTQARLTRLDTGPAPPQPGEMALAARIGKYASVKVNARIRSLTPRLNASLEAKLREVEMQTLSPYVIKMLGYRVVNGQLNGELKLRITNGSLEGKNQLVFDNLDLKPKDNASAEKLRSRLTMPLESALSMLRDKDNNVKLEVVVTGDTRDPKFDLTDAINQALTKAMRSASVSYLKYFFQPYGTLITVAELAGKTLQLRLDPVPFSPGTASLEPEARDYMAKVGKLMQERTNLRIKLCGKAVADDGLGHADALALATQRAETLKELLAGEYGIATDRLFLCEPEFDKNDAATARVDLLL